MKRPVFLPALALLAASAAAQEIKLDYDHDVDFSKYKTFAWSVAQQPVPNQANHIRITRAVEQGFIAKGLSADTAGKPDAFLMYHGQVGESVKVEGRNAGAYWEPTNLRTMVDINRVRAGTLVIEMYDAGTRDIVWRGVASNVPYRPDQAEELITAAVKKLLEGYPPKAEASPKP